jgi:hypothetical protein
VGCDERLAFGQPKIEISNQFHNLVDRFMVADIDERPVFFIMHQVDIAADEVAGLHV